MPPLPIHQDATEIFFMTNYVVYGTNRGSDSEGCHTGLKNPNLMLRYHCTIHDPHKLS